MYLKTLKILLFLALFQLQAFGITAYDQSGYASNPYLPDSICKLKFYYDQKPLEKICSAVLISSNQLLSAAHCQKRAFKKVEIYCGFQEQKITVGIKDVIPAPLYENYGIAHDIVLINLNEKLNIKPMKPVWKEDQTNRLLSLYYDTKENLEDFSKMIFKDQDSPTMPICLIAGFGKTTGLGFGALKGALANLRTFTNYQIPLEIKEDIVEKAFAAVTYKNLANVGDSGGPLYCFDKDGEASLLGITNKIVPKKALNVSEMLAPHFYWIKDKLTP